MPSNNTEDNNMPVREINPSVVITHEYAGELIPSSHPNIAVQTRQDIMSDEIVLLNQDGSTTVVGTIPWIESLTRDGEAFISIEPRGLDATETPVFEANTLAEPYPLSDPDLTANSLSAAQTASMMGPTMVTEERLREVAGIGWLRRQNEMIREAMLPEIFRCSDMNFYDSNGHYSSYVKNNYDYIAHYTPYPKFEEQDYTPPKPKNYRLCADHIELCVTDETVPKKMELPSSDNQAELPLAAELLERFNFIDLLMEATVKMGETYPGTYCAKEVRIPLEVYQVMHIDELAWAVNTFDKVTVWNTKLSRYYNDKRELNERVVVGLPKRTTPRPKRADKPKKLGKPVKEIDAAAKKMVGNIMMIGAACEHVENDNTLGSDNTLGNILYFSPQDDSHW